MWLVIEEDNKLPQKGIDIVSDGPSEKLAPKSSSFDEKTSFTSSTPKRSSQKSLGMKDKRKWNRRKTTRRAQC